jgi:hypothetical protein
MIDGQASGDKQMSTSTRDSHDSTQVAHARTRGEETKASFKTTELVVYVLAVIGVLVASNVVGDGANNDGSDYFAADKAWWFITPAHHRLHDQPWSGEVGEPQRRQRPAHPLITRHPRGPGGRPMRSRPAGVAAVRPG